MKTIITLTRYPEIFNRLRASVDLYEPEARKMVIVSGGARVWAPGWEVVLGVEPFIFARNANIGLNRVHGDVLLMNDDCELISPVLEIMGSICEKNLNIGILSPQIEGAVGGNSLQKVHKSDLEYEISKKRLAFPCVYIPHRTLQTVGTIDERFSGYGFDDDDYCYRVQQNGLDLGVTGMVIVRHGLDGKMSSSFLRKMNKWEWYWSLGKMWVEYKKKQIGL